MTWSIRANDAGGNATSYVQVGPQQTETEAREMFAATHPHLTIVTIGAEAETVDMPAEPEDK